MNNPIKVMHVLRPVMGGMRQHLIGLVSLTIKEQVETIVVCAKGEGGFKPEELPGVKIFPLDIKGDFSLHSDYQIARAILKIALAEKVNIIHAHGIKAGLLCLWSCLNRRNRFAVICTFHNQFRKSTHVLKNAINKLLVVILAKSVNHIITVSQAIRKELVEYLNVYPLKITCIYNGIDLERFSTLLKSDCLHREYAIPKYSVLIGTVARLIPQKGVSTLIKAAAVLSQEYPDLYFIIIGDGPFRESLELEAAGAGLKKRMFFTGFRKNVPELLSDLDIFALPTLEEGFSIVTLEAMAVKKPVVVSRVGGLPEVVSAESGIIVTPNDSEALETALRDLICNPAQRIIMGNAAFDRVNQKFSLNRMTEQHLNLYHGLAGNLKKNQ
ncbi:MAG TPA: glycosyltransferase family 4 protein [Bacillota bacterium]|nr:glycosyltransferase family 4 protein [Bacillota bacterium]